VSSKNTLLIILAFSVRPYVPKKIANITDIPTTIDPTGWMMSTEYKGVRIYWNGKQRLTTKHKAVIRAPTAFTQHLPPIPLEGILWCGQQNMDTAVQLINSHTTDPRWKDAKFMITDAPRHFHMTYEDRSAMLRKLLVNQPCATLVFGTPCLGTDHLTKQLESKEHDNAIILRKPDSYYHSTYSYLRASKWRRRKVLVEDVSGQTITCSL
jgi:hypothetical protein